MLRHAYDVKHNTPFKTVLLLVATALKKELMTLPKTTKLNGVACRESRLRARAIDPYLVSKMLQTLDTYSHFTSPKVGSRTTAANASMPKK